MPSARREGANNNSINGSEVKVEEKGEVDADADAEVVKEKDEAADADEGRASETSPAAAQTEEKAIVAINEVEGDNGAQLEQAENDAIVDTAESSDVVVTSSEELLAALGSAEDIAAAAIQSAGLEAILGGLSDEVTHGVKRAREETDTTDAIPDVPFTSSYDAPAIDAVNDLVQSGGDMSSTIPTEEIPATTATSKQEEEESVEETPTLDLGDLDLNAVAQAAMGLDADGNPLPGNEESHRALAEAVKQLSAAQGVTLPRTTSNHSDDGDPAKRFQCHLCERKFARAFNLHTHIATHDPDPSRSKPFPCPYPSCRTDGGRSFSRKHDLQRHVASTHDGEPEPAVESVPEGISLVQPGRKFRCDDCGRSFVRRDALKRHACTRACEGNSSSSMSSYSTPAYTRPQPDYLTNVAAGLSLYTSNAIPTSTAPTTLTSNAASGSRSKSTETKADSDPFGPNGITYENLSEEVQDMAMQLVAQAQEYNDQKESTPPPEEEAKEDPSMNTNEKKVNSVLASVDEQGAAPKDPSSSSSQTLVEDTSTVKVEVTSPQDDTET